MKERAIDQAPREHDAALQVLKLLADDTRWRLLQALRSSDRQVGELVGQLNLAQNLVSYHLGVLRQAGLVQVHRSDADARAVYYGLDIAAVRAGYAQVAASLHLDPLARSGVLPGVPVAFLCTGNSIRSQMAEAWMRHLSQGRVPVQSAGTHPEGVHPLAVQVMAEVGIDISGQQSKGLDALTEHPPAIVVTVCDNAREACGPGVGAPVQVHWSIPNPVRLLHEGSEPLATFRTIREQVRGRVEALLGVLPALAVEYRLM